MSRTLIATIVGIVLISAILYLSLDKDEQKEYDSPVLTEVKKGPFDIHVMATGELKAKNSTKIMGPAGMRTAGVFETTISDLIPEGTVVTEGSYVATLDKTEIVNKMTDLQNEIDQIQNQLEQAQIDTAIEMRGIRDQLVNLEFTREEKKLTVEQSQFEPRMIIRQAELDLEKTDRDFEQLQENYRLKKIQARAKMAEIQAKLRNNLSKLKRLEDLAAEFVIKAPSDGMLIYTRSWEGKIQSGSRLRAWDPVVAELPDLSDMISTSYVNEVDISKVSKGQEVEIRVDAFPDNLYMGYVLDVANIGQDYRGNDVKVFEVTIQVIGTDSLLRPAMTTSNKVKTNHFEEVVHIPLEAIYSDSLTYVIRKTGGTEVRQEVVTGMTNDDRIIILHGLEGGEQVYLQYDKDPTQLKLEPLDPEIKEQIIAAEQKAKEEREKRIKEQAQQVREKYTPTDEGNNNFMIIY